MKRLSLLLLLLLPGCDTNPYSGGVYTRTAYRVSDKETGRVGGKIPHSYWVVYLQGRRRVYRMDVTEQDYNQIMEGDTLTFFEQVQ